MMRALPTLAVGVLVVGAGIALAMLRVNNYLYFAGYIILQYVVIATAWNILGGYGGYVNFGTPAFFALGAYTAVFLIQSMKAPLPVMLPVLPGAKTTLKVVFCYGPSVSGRLRPLTLKLLPET